MNVQIMIDLKFHAVSLPEVMMTTFSDEASITRRIHESKQ